jgi:hypothetical protein
MVIADTGTMSSIQADLPGQVIVTVEMAERRVNSELP